MSNPYIISGGAEGKARLSVLSRVLENSTENLLLQHGLKAGKHILDLGCGGGDVSLLMAKHVGDSGSVTGVDFDANIIALNPQQAAEAGIKNVFFESASAYDFVRENAFDLTYSRFLLSHLSEPLRVLENMHRSLKPGGSIVVEDVDFSGHFCYPQNAAFLQYVEWYKTAAHRNRQNPEIGPSLPSLLRKAGFEEVGFNLIQPAFAQGEGKSLALLTLKRIQDSLLSLGIADEAHIKEIVAELEAFTASEESIIGMPRIFRAWGRKASPTPPKEGLSPST